MLMNVLWALSVMQQRNAATPFIAVKVLLWRTAPARRPAQMAVTSIALIACTASHKRLVLTNLLPNRITLLM